MRGRSFRGPLLALAAALLVGSGGCAHPRSPDLRPSNVPGLYRGKGAKAGTAKGKRKDERRGRKKGHRKHGRGRGHAGAL
jgi:hypothetical protein